mmetsp:Transcript_102711/g.299627  ORF Transcript_102711/g.299627 Transcript_102711/m.299627 type:complete len:347 (-) Transcript_102711:31-1071(-)
MAAAHCTASTGLPAALSGEADRDREFGGRLDAEVGSLQWVLEEAQVNWSASCANDPPEVHQQPDTSHMDRVVHTGLVEHLTERLTLPRPLHMVHKSGQAMEGEACCVPAHDLWTVPLLVVADIMHGMSWTGLSCCEVGRGAAPEHCPAQAGDNGQQPISGDDAAMLLQGESASQASDSQNVLEDSSAQVVPGHAAAAQAPLMPAGMEQPLPSDVAFNPRVEPKLDPSSNASGEEFGSSATPTTKYQLGEGRASAEGRGSSDVQYSEQVPASHSRLEEKDQTSTPVDESKKVQLPMQQKQGARRSREAKTVVSNLNSKTNSKVSSILGPLVAKQRPRQSGDAQSAVM